MLRPLRCAPGQPAVLNSGGVSLNSLRSNNAIPDPPESPLLGASRRANREQGPKTKDKYPTRTRHGESLFLLVFGFPSSAVWYSVPHPFWMRRGAEGQTDQGKNLFERSELFLTPAGPSTAGCPQRSGGTQQVGSPFLCLLSFGEAKESELHAGQPPASHSQQKALRRKTKDAINSGAKTQYTTRARGINHRNPYSPAGLSTRILRRTASDGAHENSKS